MVGKIDNRLLTLRTDKLHLILNRQDSLGLLPIHILLTSHVPHPQLHSPGVPLLAIQTLVPKQQRIPPLSFHRMRAIENPLSPTLLAPVQRIRPVVLGERVLAPVQVLDHPVLDAVGDPADGGAVMRRVVLRVLLLRFEAQDEVVAVDAEFLDYGSQREEGEGRFFGHGCLCLDSEVCCLVMVVVMMVVLELFAGQ